LKNKIMDFSEKSVLVIGGSSGIGRATSVYLSNLGARVFATGRTEAHIEETKALAPLIEFALIDLPKDAEKLVKWVSEVVETLDGIVFLRVLFLQNHLKHSEIMNLK